MAELEVVLSALRKAGRAAGSAGEQAHAVDVSGIVAGVEGALPGSRAASMATQVARLWRDQLEAWSREATELGRNLAVIADRYAANEDAARRSLRPGYGDAMRPV